MPVVCQDVILTPQVRVLLSTTATVELDPTATWPNEMLAGLATRLSLVVPEPPSSNANCVFEALLVIVVFPPAHPVAVGEKVMFSATLWPAARTNGSFRLDRLNPLPLTLAAETVTLVCPPLVKTTISVSVCPRGTPPKRIEQGAQVNCLVDALENADEAKSATVMIRVMKTRVEKD